LAGFHLLTGESILGDICGIAAGHLYIVLKDILPVTKNKHFLKTPSFL